MHTARKGGGVERVQVGQTLYYIPAGQGENLKVHEQALATFVHPKRGGQSTGTGPTCTSQAKITLR